MINEKGENILDFLIKNLENINIIKIGPTLQKKFEYGVFFGLSDTNEKFYGSFKESDIFIETFISEYLLKCKNLKTLDLSVFFKNKINELPEKVEELYLIRIRGVNPKVFYNINKLCIGYLNIYPDNNFYYIQTLYLKHLKIPTFDINIFIEKLLNTNILYLKIHEKTFSQLELYIIFKKFGDLIMLKDKKILVNRVNVNR